MPITQITIYAPTATMGGATEEEGDGYRKWLASEVARAFPGSEVKVVDEESANTVRTDAGADDYGQLEALQYFVQEAWGRAPWAAISAAA